jgi:hypothetical protein
VKRADAEKAIRSLVHDWARDAGVEPGQSHMPFFSEFRRWLNERGYSGYLSFRSTMGAEDDAERWFDQELRQTWRN